jgi:hypothetical protein
MHGKVPPCHDQFSILNIDDYHHYMTIVMYLTYRYDSCIDCPTSDTLVLECAWYAPKMHYI